MATMSGLQGEDVTALDVMPPSPAPKVSHSARHTCEFSIANSFSVTQSPALAHRGSPEDGTPGYGHTAGCQWIQNVDLDLALALSPAPIGGSGEAVLTRATSHGHWGGEAVTFLITEARAGSPCL
jgi:hypothetical protein